MIPHSRPTLGRKEEQAVVRVLRSGQAGGGEEVARFERELARRVRVRHATATHTGTAALHLALMALGIGRGARVLIPSYVCAAVRHAVCYVGARPVLVDVDPATCNLDPADAKRKARGAAAVVVPHMFGLPAPVEEIRRLKLPIVEDCAMSIGASSKGRPCGGLGDVSVFSFYATKMLATGHGGAVATSDRRIASRIADLVTYDNRDDLEVRYNYRMSAVGAALGRVQLARAAEFVRARRRIAKRYAEAFRRLPLRLPPDRDHIYYRFVVRARQALARRLQERGVEAKRPVYRPLHLYSRWSAGRFPGADELHRTVVSLPIYPSLSAAECDRVIRAVTAAFRDARA